MPADVYGCVNLRLHGEVHAAGRALPRAFLTGPFTRPLSTQARAPLRSPSVVIQPWVLAPWFDRPACGLVDDLVDLAALPALACARVTAMLARAARMPGRLDEALEALSQGRSPVPGDAPRMAAALLAHARVADAAKACTLGERQFERRFRSAFGLRPVQWRRIRRFEAVLPVLNADAPPFAALAAGAGDADQARMTRNFRRIAALTPADGRAALASDTPGTWALRAARVR